MTDSSTHTATSTAKGSLFIISACSGTGKTSLVKQLLSTLDNLSVSVSHTTRPPRPSEIDGTHYHFTTVDNFEASVQAGEFLEYAKVFDNYYGTAKSSVHELLNQGIDVILEIDWQGALQVKQLYEQGELAQIVDELKLIFILPPSRQALAERLSLRAQDSEQVIQTRLSGALTELQQYDKFDYLVINDNFDQALTELSAIIICTRQAIAKQQVRHASLIDTLLNA